MSRIRWIKILAVPFLLMLISLGSATCRGSGDRAADNSSTPDASEDEPTSDLTFNNITLEQSDEEGQTLWKIDSKQATYSQNRQFAELERPKGDFFRDGEPAISFEAERGEVREGGEQLFLRGSVVATDLDSGAVLKGDEVEWLPAENVVVVRNNVTGTHPEFNLSADEAKAFIDEQRIELTGNIVATTGNQDTRLEGQHLIWRIDQEKVISDRPFQVQRLQNRRPTDQASADQAEFNLATKTATLQQNGLIISQEPPLRVTGDSLVWDMDDQTVVANQPVTIVHRAQQTTITANRGRGNLATEVFNFIGNVRAIAQRNQSQLTSDRLTWNVATQNLEAEGNVTYQQVDPVLNLRGGRAVGKLEDQTIVVSGGRVVTEIVPE
ncbi:MAG: LPS export ABC transporter periplasmic protein LptC [Elainellaceae cyanobacterium]